MISLSSSAGSVGRADIGRLVRRATVYFVLAVAALLVLLPLALIVSNAFKTENEIFAYPVSWIPRSPTLDNFLALRADFPRYIFNSFRVTIIIVAVQLVTATTGAYAFAKLQWRLREVLFIVYIASMMVPVQTFIIPQFIIVRNLGLYDSHAALVFVSAFTAIGTFMTKQFFMSIPDSLLESARIDGAGSVRIFLEIVLPLSKPVIAVVGVLSFRWFWNEFFNALIYITSEELKTLPLGLSDFVSEYAVFYGPQMAASLVSIIPVLIVFFAGQRYFVEGVATTGIKG